MSRLFLGFDVGTQTLKCSAIEGETDLIVERFAVNYDDDLPEFRTKGGVHCVNAPWGVEATTPTLLWVKSFDSILAQMRERNFRFGDVVGVSFSGQQHGSVYWRQNVDYLLGAMNPQRTLFEELTEAFSVSDSPIWMDSSTGAECREIEDAVFKATGRHLVAVSGSRLFERFTAAQLRKKFKKNPRAMEATEAVSLVSSFAASLFGGGVVAIDAADAAGTNLVDMRTSIWSDACLKACAPDEAASERLRKMLKPIVASDSIVGTVSNYFVKRFGFNPQCLVVAATGDNPSSLAGMRTRPGDLVVSMGTSDTVFAWLDELPFDPPPFAFVLANPLSRGAFMGMSVYKNGSLTRESVRDSVSPSASPSWAEFDRLLAESKPGNEGNLAFFFTQREIWPEAEGIFRFDAKDESVLRYHDQRHEVRALIEGQLIAKRIHAEEMGFSFRRGRKIRVLATGGASANPGILRILSDVMQAPVFVLDVPDSASLGAALRAKHAVVQAAAGGVVNFHDAVAETEFRLAASPDAGAEAVYAPLLERYRKLEKKIVEKKLSKMPLPKALATEKFRLYNPPLEEVGEVFASGLRDNFHDVEVRVVTCPDLSTPPFGLAAPGLCGDARLADVGGVGNLIPTPRPAKTFSFEEIASAAELSNGAALIGPGAGDSRFVGTNCEMMANLRILGPNHVVNRSRFSKVGGNDECALDDYQTMNFALMANLFLSRGEIGPVLEVKSGRRKGDRDFINCLRSSLQDKYGKGPTKKIVAAGGVFNLVSGRAKFHVMPDFPEKPFNGDADVDNWLRFFNFRSPMTVVSAFVSEDIPGQSLRIEHSHGWSDHGEGGHYHYDVTPDDVAYHGFFNVAEYLYKIEKPA